MTATANPLDFADKVVIVTGGTKGVGRGITTRFLEAGANVVMTARNEPEQPIEIDGRIALYTPADIREPEAAASVIEFAIAKFGRLDAVVNNAGGSPHVEAATVSPRFSESIIRLNLSATLHIAQAANAVMQNQDEGGSIINIASVSGMRPSPGTAAYGAAKAGVINLTTTLAMEWGPKVRVNAVTPGYIATEQAHMHYGDDEGIKRVAEIIPLKRMGTPTDIGDACLFLASPLASYVSGANLAVHGGGEAPPFLEAGNAN